LYTEKPKTNNPDIPTHTIKIKLFKKSYYQSQIDLPAGQAQKAARIAK
jgi:hypothetical protein